MNKNILNLVEKITPEEQQEVEDFINFLIIKRKLKTNKIFTNDIPSEELIKLIEKAGGFDWLNNTDEDIYSINDGASIQW